MKGVIRRMSYTAYLESLEAWKILTKLPFSKFS